MDLDYLAKTLRFFITEEYVEDAIQDWPAHLSTNLVETSPKVKSPKCRKPPRQVNGSWRNKHIIAW